MNYCSKCGSNANHDDAFCKNCGTRLSLEGLNPINKLEQKQSNNSDVSNVDISQNHNYYNYNSSINSDEELINAYIGKNAYNLKDGSFSVLTFFFGFYYVVYRKMWLLGFIWFVISLIAVYFLRSLYGIISLASNIVISINFKKYYLKHVIEQVKNIKENNLGKSRAELISICAKKGGTSIIPFVSIFLVIFAIGILLAIVFSTIKQRIIDRYNYYNYYESSYIVSDRLNYRFR